MIDTTDGSVITGQTLDYVFSYHYDAEYYDSYVDTNGYYSVSSDVRDFPCTDCMDLSSQSHFNIRLDYTGTTGVEVSTESQFCDSRTVDVSNMLLTTEIVASTHTFFVRNPNQATGENCFLRLDFNIHLPGRQDFISLKSGVPSYLPVTVKWFEPYLTLNFDNLIELDDAGAMNDVLFVDK